MKKILWIILLVSINTFGQNKNNNLFYFGGGLELGNHLGLDANFIYVYKNKYSFSVGGIGMLHGISNYPSDKDDTDSLPFYSVNDTGHLYLGIGKIVSFKNVNKFRLNLSMSIAKTKGTRTYNFIRGEKTDHGYHYSYNVEVYDVYSVIFNPKLEWTFFKTSGFYISPKVILNKKKNFYGVGFGLMLGKVK